MDRPIVNTLGVCSGAGMLEVGVSLGLEYLGFRSKIAALCEWEAYATACLLARMEEQSLEPAPIWSGDLADFPAKSFRGMVDIVVAGFPCQPWSHAGKQEGTADDRWLWPQLARILRDTQSPLGFFENVPGLISGGGLHHVLDDIADLGMDAVWCSLTAESVGASHKRQRVFILAYKRGMADSLWFSRQQPWAGRERVFNEGQKLAESQLQPGDLHGGQCAGIPDPDRASGNVDNAPGDGNGKDNGILGAASQAVADTPSAGGQRIGGSDGIPSGASKGKVRSGRVRGKQRPAVNEQLELRDPELALPPVGRFGKLREPPQRNGLPECSDEALGNAGRNSPAAGERGLHGETIDPAGGEAGDSELRRPPVANAPSGDGGKQPRPDIGGLSEPDGRANRELADPQQPGSQGNGPGIPQRGSEPIARDGNGSFLPLFAPGPAADWSEIPAHLWPAVEPGFCVMVNGLAVVVDESRSDALRVGGNGVCPLQAAVAFCYLMRAAGLAK